jgi:uncharacterized protein
LERPNLDYPRMQSVECVSLVHRPSYVPDRSERISAAIAHGGTCLAWFLAPLIVYLLERDRSPWAARQALQALLWSGLGTLVSLATCGLAIPIFLAFHIVAACRAYEGQDYSYPFVGDFLRGMRSKVEV